jgi:chemotaxis protein methyltransferase CheR
METTITQQDYRELRELIEERCGVALGEDGHSLLQSRLAPLLRHSGLRGYGDLARWCAANDSPVLRARLLDSLTSTETSWFRDPLLWNTLQQRWLPEWARRIEADPSQRVRIWSAGCATGQEPFSLAMLIDAWCEANADRGPVRPHHFEILATDISPAAIFVAMAARYSHFVMAHGLTGPWAWCRSRYFTPSDGQSVLAPAIVGRVRFQRASLLDDPQVYDRFDLVLLRNVAMYYTPAFKRRLFDRLGENLAPAGRLAVGVAETLAGYTQRFAIERDDGFVSWRARDDRRTDCCESGGARPAYEAATTRAQ